MKKNILILAILIALTSQNGFCDTYDAQSNAQLNEYYNNAVTLFKANKYSSAILEFKKVLRARPYDDTVKNALVSAYLARAEYYANQNSQPKKAIVDLKSALYYLKYWNSENLSEKQQAMAGSVQKSLKEMEASSTPNQSAAQRFENAKLLRFQDELPAAGYEFAQLFNNATYAMQAYQNAGDIYKSLNNQLDAINSYRNAIKIDPKNANIHFRYALILEEIGNNEAAGEEYNLALQYGDKNPELLDKLEQLWLARTIENPKNAQAFINLGTVLQKKGDYTNARIQYEKAQALDPTDSTAALNLASLYVSNNNFTQVIPLYDSMLAKNPNDTKVLGYKAVAYEKLNDWKSAINTYKKILEIDPTNKVAAEAVDELARKNLTGQDLLAYLENYAQKYPQDYQAQYDCAYELHKIGNVERAIPYYKKSIAIDPKKPEGYVNLAQIYYTKGDIKSAEEVINAGLSYKPNDTQLSGLKETMNAQEANNLFESAASLWNQKDYKGALEKYLKIPPKMQTVEVLSAIGSCYFELNDWRNAINYYEKAIAQKPNDTEIMYALASAYLELNQNDKAKIYLDKILVLEPDNQQAKTALGLLEQSSSAQKLNEAAAYIEQKNYPKAMLALDEVIKIDPKSAYAFYYKGVIYENQKKISEAVIQYKKAITLDPGFISAYYSVATLLDGQEKYSEAVSYYDKFIELKTKEGTQKDEYTTYAKKRSAELKAYLKNAASK